MTPGVSSTSYADRATAYARSVVSKDILTSRWVRLACQRHLDDLNRRDFRWHYDPAKAHKICSFAEMCRHEKGPKQGERIKLVDAQVFILVSIFAWVDNSGIRKYRQALVMLPRGNGKSPLAAIISLFCAFFDDAVGAKGAEVYCGANRERQAMEVFRPAKAMVEQESAFTERFGIVAAAKSIFQPATRSRLQTVVRKPGDGASIWAGILDELHEALDATLLDTFVTGLNKRPGSLLLVISTAGVSSLENPCLEMQRKGEAVLEGTVDDDRLFVLIHCADLDVDWTSPLAVEQANPLLNIANDREAILLDQKEAIRNPAKANTFRAKHLNQWSSADSAWMSMPALHKCADPTLTLDRCKHLPAILGADFSQKIDLTALTLVFRDDSKESMPHYYAFSRSYLPEARVNDPALQHFAKWAAKGQLTATDRSSIDEKLLIRDALAWTGTYNVREIAYDPTFADSWSLAVSDASGITRVEMPQKTWMLTPGMKELESAIYDGRFHWVGDDQDPVLAWCIGNVKTHEMPNGLYAMPDKSRAEAKIDAAVSLFIAMSRAMLIAPPKPTGIVYRGLRSI